MALGRAAARRHLPWMSGRVEAFVEQRPVSVAVLLMHRQAIVREGIHSLLQRTQTFRVAVDCQSPDEAVALLKTHACDLVLAELDGSGLQLAHNLARSHTQLPLVLLAGERPKAAVLKVALDLRLRACVDLQEPEDIIRGLEAVVRRQRYLTPSWGLELLAEPVRQIPEVQLTERELQILAVFDAGHSLGRVAESLCLSPSTVKSHLSRIYRKLGVSRRSEACVIARELGLIPVKAKD